MKVYNQNGNSKVKRSKSAIWYVLLMVATVVFIALSITLAVINSSHGASPSLPVGGQEQVDPVTTKPTKYVLPFEDYTVAKEASLEKLVYMPSVNMWKTHNGVDFLPGNNDKVAVMADGKVKSVEQSSLEGWIVTIDHGDGLMSYYKSLASASVTEGAAVKAGDVIGTAGIMISEKEIGKHVHIEVTKNGALTDPLGYLNTDSSK